MCHLGASLLLVSSQILSMLGDFLALLGEAAAEAATAAQTAGADGVPSSSQSSVEVQKLQAMRGRWEKMVADW